MGIPSYPVPDDMKFITGQSGARYIDLPDIEHDLNVAMQLPLVEGESLELHRFGDTYAARVSISVSSRIAEANPSFQTGANPARLVSEVWYAHRQKHQARGVNVEEPEVVAFSEPNRHGIVRWAFEHNHVTGLAVAADLRYIVESNQLSKDDDETALDIYRAGLKEPYISELNRFIDHFNASGDQEAQS